MVAVLHPATEARLARAGRDEAAAATRATARQLATLLDDEWATRTAAARRVDGLRADLDEVPRGDARALLAWVRRAGPVLAEVSASLAPEGVAP